jgi:hypothetical protein
MIDQFFETFRKASESTLQAQQDMFKQWVQSWPSPGPFTSGVSKGDWGELQKRVQESTSEALNKQRELLDSAYRSGIDVIEHSFRFSEARSADDYRRIVEELWRKVSDTFKAQSETQARDFQSATERWLDRTQNANDRSAS